MLGIFNTITINGKEILRPNDFEMEQEPIYAAEYTTMTGKTIADLIGWKWAAKSLEWDFLPDDQLQTILAVNGEANIQFKAADGVEYNEVFIPTAKATVGTRLTDNGKAVWKDVKLSIKFINAH